MWVDFIAIVTPFAVRLSFRSTIYDGQCRVLRKIKPRGKMFG